MNCRDLFRKCRRPVCVIKTHRVICATALLLLGGCLLGQHPLHGGLAALLLGLILTASLISLVSVLETRPARLEKLAQMRTLQLKESEEKYRNLFDNMTNGFALHEMVYDQTGRPADYRFLAVNPAFEKLTGLRTENLIGRTVKEVLPQTEVHWIERYGNVVRTGSPVEFQEYSGALGRWFDIRAFRPSLGCFAATFTDITERKQAEESLHRLLTAIEQSSESVVITGPNGQIEYANPAFEVITGYSREEAEGRNPKFLKSGQQDPAFYVNLWKTITNGTVWEGTKVNKRKDGRLYTEQASISPVRDDSGTITGYVAIGRDITEELAKEEQFRQNQKIQALGQLAGGIAHDFNNILQVILGFSEILLGRLGPESPEYCDAEEIQKAARKATDLTRQLLTFSRKQSVHPNRLDLNSAVRDAEVFLKLLLGESIHYCIELSPDPCEIYADHSQITQIIMNLAINARDAMPDGGRLTLAVEKGYMDAHDPEGRPDAEPGTFICMSVTDTGCGMTPEVQEHLFEPFFTTKEAGEGTGLGLSVVYGIVKQNKGWIHVYSEEGQGSSFKIYLPACRPGGPHAIRPPGSEPPYHARILLVEDDADMSRLAARILENAGYKVTACANAEEALRLVEKEEGLFDLLFSDMILPGADGLELAKRMRSSIPDQPVLLYSGNPEPYERGPDLESGQYGFLRKPFSMSGLLAAVHNELKIRR